MAKFTVKSNYDNFSRHIQDVADMLDIDAYLAMDEVLEWICNEMKQEIINKKDTWCEEWSPLDEDASLGSDIEYEIRDNKATIYIGRNTKKLTMQDGTSVSFLVFLPI